MTARERLIEEAEREYAGLREALDGLDEAAMERTWLGTWGIKELLAHMTAWHREMIPALERLSRGDKPVPEGVSYEDIDAWNARFAAGARARAGADLERELDASHAAFLRAAAAVPAERVVEGKAAYRIIDLNAGHHYREHAEQIRAWRAAGARPTYQPSAPSTK